MKHETHRKGTLLRALIVGAGVVSLSVVWAYNRPATPSQSNVAPQISKPSVHCCKLHQDKQR